MRRPSLAVLLIASLAATSTLAQTPVSPGKGALTIPTPAPVQTPAPKPAVVAWAAPQRLTLTGLADHADAGPACRAQCTRTRLTCEANDDNCTPGWNTCLQRCSAAR